MVVLNKDQIEAIVEVEDVIRGEWTDAMVICHMLGYYQGNGYSSEDAKNKTRDNLVDLHKEKELCGER